MVYILVMVQVHQFQLQMREMAIHYQLTSLDVSAESRFSGMAHFDGNIHLCNNGDNIGGRIYFGDGVDMDENSANVYINHRTRRPSVYET